MIAARTSCSTKKPAPATRLSFLRVPSSAAFFKKVTASVPDMKAKMPSILSVWIACTKGVWSPLFGKGVATSGPTIVPPAAVNVSLKDATDSRPAPYLA